MKKNIALVCCMLLLYSANIFAQQKNVYAALAKYQLDTSLLNPKMANNALDYSHQLTRVLTTDNNTKTFISSYDPAKKDLERWKLLSVNGRAPSKKELKNFDKEHEFKGDYKLDVNTLKIMHDDGRKLNISYQYDPSTLDSDHKFLKDCLFTFVINIETKRLERILQKNLKDLKVKIVKMPKLTGESIFTYFEKEKIYLIAQQEVVAVIKLAGSQASMTTTDTYKYQLD